MGFFILLRTRSENFRFPALRLLESHRLITQTAVSAKPPATPLFHIAMVAADRLEFLMEDFGRKPQQSQQR